MLETGSRTEHASVTFPATNRNTASFHDLAIPLTTHANAFDTNAFALSIADTFRASVTGYAFAFDPIVPVAGPFDAVPSAIIEELIARSESEARENAMSFEQQAQRHKANVETKILRSGRHEAGHAFASAARNFDLSIVPQLQPEDDNLPNFAEAALFDSGHPVILVPYIQKTPASFKRVLVCWDGSRAAARAIADAWPILERADAVDIVTAGDESTVYDLQQGLGQHFAQHGVAARLHALPVNDIDVGNAILSHAADMGATMIVMGGYGHGRAREWALGGVTRTVLKTMTVPVLISH